jgi:3-phosphoshikimate 1-carboxyvinyltransferase
MATELRKIGATVDEGRRLAARDAACAASQREHRHLRRPPHGDVLLAGVARGTCDHDEDPACVGKTFPDYFTQFARVTQ